MQKVPVIASLKSIVENLSIGKKIGAGMTLAAIFVIAIAASGIVGISSIGNTLNQTGVATSVLIQVNAANGSVSEFILNKNPNSIEKAEAHLDLAIKALQDDDGQMADQAISTEIANMNREVLQLMEAQSKVQAGSTDFLSIADSLREFAAKAEKLSADAVNESERQTGIVFINLDRARKIIYSSGDIRAAGLQLARLLTKNPEISPGAVGEMTAILNAAQPAMKEVVTFGGTPNVQHVVKEMESAFQTLRNDLEENAASAEHSSLSPLVDKLVSNARQLNTIMAEEVTSELASKKETDNIRSGARVVGGMVKNFAKLINSANLSANNYRLTPSDELSESVKSDLKRATGFAKILGKKGYPELLEGLLQIVK